MFIMIGACKSSRLANQKDNFPISLFFADARRVIRFNFPKMRKSVFPAASDAEISNFPKLNLPDDRGAIIGNFPKPKQENGIFQNDNRIGAVKMNFEKPNAEKR